VLIIGNAYKNALLTVAVPRHPRACLYLEWNPVETKLVGIY